MVTVNGSMQKSVWEMLRHIDPGANVQTVVETEECKILKAQDNSGEGIMTMYQVFDGVYLMYNDFHMKECMSQFQTVETLLCIDHCREGRMEHMNEKGAFYMEAGDLRVDRRVHHEGHVRFPLCHYHGITIGFQSGIAEKAIKKAMPEFEVDFKGLAEKFCNEEKPFVIHKEPAVEHIFSELYQVPAKVKKEYFKIKVMELLIYLDALELSDHKEERPYFFVGQIEKVKAIHELMTSDLTKSYTLEELSKRFDIALTSMKNCFKSVYGSPVNTYMRNYKMNYAASLLLSNREMKVADIALLVGYDSPSKFSAAFHKTMKMTPLEYRKSQSVTSR